MNLIIKTARNNMLFIILMAILVILNFARSTDDTDKSRFNRSGMSLYTDHGTGCQYISTQNGMFGKGQLMPRLDKDGKHVCVK